MKEKKKLRSDGPVLLRLLHGSWSYFLVCIVSGLVFTGCELLIPQIIRVSVDSFIGNAAVHVRAAERVVAALGGTEHIRGALWIPAAVLVGVGLLSAMFRFLTNLYSAKAGETLVKTSRGLLYHHIQHLPWKWQMQNPTGDIIQRCTSDVEVVRNFIAEQMVELLSTVR